MTSDASRDAELRQELRSEMKKELKEWAVIGLACFLKACVVFGLGSVGFSVLVYRFPDTPILVQGIVGFLILLSVLRGLFFAAISVLAILGILFDYLLKRPFLLWLSRMIGD